MSGRDVSAWDELLARVRSQATSGDVRVTQHAQEEMAEEGIVLGEVIEALQAGAILENYPGHRRGACCLIYGRTMVGRHLHVVCTTARPVLILITAYEPTPPKWPTPTQRRQPT